ncbi:MAG: TIGR02757 family protein [Campylobacterales bacterium]|nr:TIGR02757 family protein [Campylobacterales bacterium]
MESSLSKTKELLENEYIKYNTIEAVSRTNLDPILIAKKYSDESISLICALFAYGNVTAIVKFLESLDFSLLEKSPELIEKKLANHYYRFQKADDVINLFKSLRKLKDIDSIETLFFEGYNKEESVLDGLEVVISKILTLENPHTKGYDFLVGRPPQKEKTAGQSTLKRWNMYLRWMIRKDNIDLGLWNDKPKKDLILPLDTHTFKVSHKLKLLKRKSYDLKSSLLITEKLQKFDRKDPVKYDFALYRIGQNNLL